MFQIGWSFDTDRQEANWFMDIIRKLFALIDKAVFNLLAIVYEIFFNIADATIFSSDTIIEFYGRVQMIIGIFMIFKVSVSLMQSVIDPDQLTNKDTGLGKIITRIVTMLALFTAIIPLNIPNAEEGSYNAYLNENGLIFGVLYSLQHRILSQNVIGKLVLGDVSHSGSVTEAGSSSTGGSIRESANQLATFVLKTFVRINLIDNATEEGASDPANYYCEANYDYTRYAKPNATPNDVLDEIAQWCDGKDESTVLGFHGVENTYSFTYTLLLPTICGGILVFILLGFCVDIAIRALKLAFLRLIAPIPIISYIDPKSSKDGAFAGWVKAISSTYLDLFFRLIIIFFIIFIVQQVIENNGFVLPISSGLIGAISTVFIIIGLFSFASIAPKFIRDALGLKGAPMSNVGLSAISGAAGALAGGAGLAGAASGALNGFKGATSAAAQGKSSAGTGWSAGSELAAQITTGDPHAKGGMVGSLARKAQRTAQQRTAERELDRNYGINTETLNRAHDSAISSANKAKAMEIAIENNWDRAVYIDAQGNQQTVDMSPWTNDEKQAALSGAQAEAAKAQKDYDKASKVAEKYGLDVSFEEEHRASVKERFKQTVTDVRHPFKAKKRRRQEERQSVGQRFAGDNKWNPK